VSEHASGAVRFLDFSLDAANARLQRGSEVIALRPKTLAVLEHLAARPGRLVTKAELLETVWAETVVTESVLTGCIRELRRALEDDPRAPRVIETAHRHGYRFIAPIRPDGPATSPRAWGDSPTVVGRTADLADLMARLEDARRGRRQLVLIAGEAGVGKTTLVDAFCAGVGGEPLWIARGQCLPQYGETEPYLPVLEAFTRLAGTEAGASFRASLRQHAPAWLVQIPSLLEPHEAAKLRRSLVGTTRERMLREGARLVEELDRPLVLVLEDLHWCDYATLDLLAALAHRRDPAALLVIGTYRPADVIVSEHPLKAVVHDLVTRAAGRQMWLENLDPRNVVRYLDLRCHGLARGDELAHVVYERTDGHPFFMRSVVDSLVARGALVVDDGRWTLTIEPSEVGVDVPAGLAQMIQSQVDRLAAADRTVLEAASVVGREPSAAAVAAALGADLLDTEDRLTALALRGPFLRAAGEITWPDGTAAGAYELTHALYQKVLHDGIPPARRRLLHRRIADRLEAVFADRHREIAADLALHLEEAREVARAVPHLHEAAARAESRGASREAVTVFRRALHLLATLPPSSERTLHTIRASLALGLTLQTLEGWAHPDVERSFERALELSAATDDLPQLFQVLAALIGNRVSRADLARARADGDRLETLAARMPFPGVVQVTDILGGIVRYHMGPLSEARVRLERGLSIEGEGGDSGPIPIQFGVLALGYLGLVRLHEGRPDEARACLRRAAERAAAAGTSLDRAHNATLLCFMSFFLRDLTALEAEAAKATDIGRQLGARLAVATGKIGHGRVLVARGDHDAGLAAIREGIAEHRAAGQRIALPSQLAVLVEALADAARIDEALDVVSDARRHVESTGDVRYLAELHRLEGELYAHSQDPRAEACFERAIAVAQQQGSRWWELRARTSVVEWRRAHGKPVDRADLATFVTTFTEGEATADLRAARRAASGT
jgi:DNA-binding winged helix-turn-helix (wHTH) protein/tetratricopeptide (TPR) repeat protein